MPSAGNSRHDRAPLFSGMSVGLARSHSWRFMGCFALNLLLSSLRTDLCVALLGVAVNRI